MITALEYLHMGQTGAFPPDARLELIEGEIVEMAPIGSPHASVVMLLHRTIDRQAGDRAMVWSQSPVVVGERSVPQPDIAVLQPRADGYFGSHPRSQDVLLVIEVSDTTLRFDLSTKVPLSARAGIAEAWVVDIERRVLHVFREPDAGGYRTSFVVSGHQEARPAALSAVAVSPAKLFPA